MVTPIITREEFMVRRAVQYLRDREKPTSIKDIGGTGTKHWWVIEQGTLLPQTNTPFKVLTLERMRFVAHGAGERGHGDSGAKPGDHEYRFGYYIACAKRDARRSASGSGRSSRR